MSASNKTFLALYLTPHSVLAEWAQTEPGKKKAAEEKMRNDWNSWMGAHSKMIADTKAGGKTKRVTPDGVSDIHNEIMLYSVVEAETHEAAAAAFATHPHLQIPQATIEIMEIRPMGG
jgi:hypothetical protein